MAAAETSAGSARAEAVEKAAIRDIHLPKNTPVGIYIGMATFVFGFAVVWHIYWLVGLSALALLVIMIVRLTSDDTEYMLSAARLKALEAKGTKGVSA